MLNFALNLLSHISNMFCFAFSQVIFTIFQFPNHNSVIIINLFQKVFGSTYKYVYTRDL